VGAGAGDWAELGPELCDGAGLCDGGLLATVVGVVDGAGAAGGFDCVPLGAGAAVGGAAGGTVAFGLRASTRVFSRFT
jgi:hypothetical protein